MLFVDMGSFVLQIRCDRETIESLSKDEDVELHTHLVFNQDGVAIYGFLKESKLRFFEKIMKVSKIGPRTALRIISSTEAGMIARLIKDQDADRLARIPGIGKKTAERLIMELKDEDLGDISQYTPFLTDAVEALVSLGFSRGESNSAVRSVYQQGMGISDIVREALAKLGRKGSE